MPDDDNQDDQETQQAKARYAANSQYALPGPYLTKLNDEDEAAFQQWVQKNNIPFDPSGTADYDMRGFWKASASGDPRASTAVSKFDDKLHFSDVWKTPYHRTFSNQSMYSTKDAPQWVGDKLIDYYGRVIADETPEENKK